MFNAHTFVRRKLSIVLAVALAAGLVMLGAPAAHGAPAGDPLLNENFDYGGTIGDLTAVSTWTAHNAGGTNPIQYSPTGLSLAGYAASGVGGAAVFISSGEDVNRTFTEQSAGDVYLAALVRISTATTTGDYFLHLIPTGSTNYRGRIYAKDDGSGNLLFGISSAGVAGTVFYGTTTFSYNMTYLIVAKYNVTDCNSALYALTAYSATEPATPLATSTTTNPALAISAVAIRQGGSTSGSTGVVDGIRVATTWVDAVGALPSVSLAKTVTPDTNVDYHGTVTYTVVMNNPTAVSDTAALLTDTLPVSITFGSWIDQPAGASESGDQITWGGTLTNSAAITLSFTAVHTGTYEDVVANTAQYSGSVALSTTATFTVVSNMPHVTLSKLASPDANVTPGGDVNYTLVLANDGLVDDASVTLTDSLPVSVIFDHWLEQPVGAQASGNQITWSGAISSQQSLTFTFVVAHLGGYGETVINTAEFVASYQSGSAVASFTTAPPPTEHLLLSEIVANPTEGEYIEIYNPGPTALDLSNVYLTDATFAGGGTYYYNIVTGANAGGGSYGDFHARFPAGASIDPGERQVVALNGSNNFVLTYGMLPTYELYEDAGVPDSIPDMLEALSGSIAGQGGLTNDGEVVILYQWDGASDLVEDLDYVVWGDKAEAVSKTGVSMDGPDAGTTTSTYLADTATGAQAVVSAGAHSGGQSWQRVDNNEGTEKRVNGNGIDGHDETSENLGATWTTAAVTPPEEPTPPGVVATYPSPDATGVSLYRPLQATFNEALNAATVNATTFLLEGPSGPVGGAVGYESAAWSAIFTPTTALAALSRYTATLTTGIRDLQAGTAMEADYIWSFTSGEADTISPTITTYTPTNDATGVVLNANVTVAFSEDINPASLAGRFYLSDASGTLPAGLSYNPTTWVATLNPTANLNPTTTYTVTVLSGVADWAGWTLGADTTWRFTSGATAPMEAYFGDIHNHTSYSDGSGTPVQALAAGKAAGFDFMAISDHSYAIDDGEWASTLSAVNDASQDGEFVALRGFEYTQGAEGHINVYNSVRHAVRTDTTASCTYCDYTPNLEQGVTVEGFYHWMANNGLIALDESGTLLHFNHPGWINFNDWVFHPELSATARLEEVGNGNGTSYAFSEEEYIRSLDYGWKVGATNNADTHSSEWGTNTDHRTGAWMQGLTRADLMEAMRQRRTFATEDKNFALYLKANGEWMGQVIPNTGSLAFEIYGDDADGELVGLVQLITNHGLVAAETTPGGATFTWQPAISITEGLHYYYVKVTQPDGDRIVSSPVWTEGAEDISISDLTIQPSVPTTHNPSLLTARVTNRGPATQTITVNFYAEAAFIDAVTLTVGACALGPCDDGYANISWQPTLTGPLTVTAMIAVAPAGDNPDDNVRSLALNATDQKIPLVLIDSGHSNVGTSNPRDASHFADDLTEHGYNVLFNLDEITAGDLNTETTKLLIINAYGPDQLAASEISAIADFVAAGGSLWLNSMSDYTGKVAWANTIANRLNGLVASVEITAGNTIPIRFNDDEVLDGDDHNGYPWGVLWHVYPYAQQTGVGLNVVQIQSWSDASLVDRDLQALTQSDLGADGFLFIQGDADSGTGLYGYPKATTSTDADGEGDAFLYDGVTNLMAGAAGYDIPGQAGRLFFYGDSNDPFNIFAYTAGDGKQNELFNLEVVMWLLGEPLHKVSVATARYDDELNNTPDNLNKMVWIEGEITAGYGEFFNVLYIQDETGGVTVHAPAGDIYAGNYLRGTKVRAVGTVGIYQGDTEIEFFEAEMVQVLTPTTGLEPAPISMSTLDASLESNEGWLVQVTGTVVSKVGQDTIFVDDGSGAVRAFLDGYNGDFSDVGVGYSVSVMGLVSEDGLGRRIRVRNHLAHPSLPDDVVILASPAVWTGAQDSDWDNANNWGNSLLPAPTDAVLLDPAYQTGALAWPVLNLDAAINTLTIYPQAELTIPAGFTLTVESAVVNSGTLHLTRANNSPSALHIANSGGDAIYYGMVITPAESMGSVSASIYGHSECTMNDPTDTVNRCYSLSAAVPSTATIRFYYLDSELDGFNPASMQVWYWDTNTLTWTAPSALVVAGGSAPNWWVEVSDVPASLLSAPLTLALRSTSAPTAVGLQALAAHSSAPLALLVTVTFALGLVGYATLRRRRKA